MIRLLIFVFLILIGAFLGFIFYASQPNMTESDRYQVITYEHAPEKRDTLKVLTYNLGYLSGMTNNRPDERPSELFDKNMQQVLAVLDTLTPDFIGLQEIDFQSSRSYEVNQVDTLGYQLGFHTAYRSVNWDKQYVPFPYWPLKMNFGKMVSGQAILSKYPIIEAQTVTLEMPEDMSGLFKLFYIDRLLQVSLIKVGEDTVAILNVHLEAWDEPARVRQIEEVGEYYGQYASRYPTLLIGDFNSKPAVDNDQHLATVSLMENEDIASAISDKTYLIDPKRYYTFSSREPYQMIDYIYYNPSKIQSLQARVVNEVGEASDHLPVLMTFVLKR